MSGHSAMSKSHGFAACPGERAVYKRLLATACAALLSGCVLPPGVPYALPVAGSSNVAIGGIIPGGAPVVLNPFAPPVIVPGGLLIGLPTLEGRWVLLGQDGARQCVTIQDARISILIQDCAADSTGRSATIREAPQAELSGPELVLSVRYIGELF